MKEVADTFHLLHRAGVWYFRRRIPEHLQTKLGRKFIQHSLGTSNKAEAKKRRTIAELNADALFEAAGNNSISLPTNSGAPPKHSISLAAITEHLRQFVQRSDLAFRTRFAEDGPEDLAQVREMGAEATDTVRTLTNIADAQRHELIYHAGARMLKELGGWSGNAKLDASSGELVRRAEIELSRRRLAYLDNEFDRPFFDSLFDPAIPPGVTFGELAEQYFAEKTEEGKLNGFSQKRIDKINTNITLIREIVGDSTPVHAIGYDMAKKVQLMLATLPTNRVKFYPGLNLEQAIKKGEADGRATLSPITQNQYLDTFRDALQLALRKKLLGHNPVEGVHALKQDKIAGGDKRRSWSLEQIKAFFTSDFYAACAPNAVKPYAKMDRDWRFWLPLICLFMGMRPNEVCQLLLSDVKQTKAGTWFLDVAISDDEEGVPAKTLKTAASRRRVPIHPELIAIGFLDFVERRRAEKTEPQLLPGLKPDKYGNMATYALKRFRDSFIPAAIELEDRQSFYSLRHSFRDALRRCEAPPAALQALAGWSQGKLVSDNYGDQADPDYQRYWIAKITYPGLDISFLHSVATEQN